MKTELDTEVSGFVALKDEKCAPVYFLRLYALRNTFIAFYLCAAE